MNRQREKRGEAARTVQKPNKARDEVLTPLSRTLLALEAPKRVTPLDLFTLARTKFFEGERLDIGRLAKELGVGRATLFRWVGSREQLYGEILSAGYVQEFQRARDSSSGKGVERFTAVTRRVLMRLVKSVPLRRFVEQDPEFAIRVLTSKDSPVHKRCIELQRQWLEELEQAGEIHPALDVDSLAYIIVHIGEAFLYSDVLADRAPDIEKAAAAIRILVAATPEDGSKPALSHAGKKAIKVRLRAVKR